MAKIELNIDKGTMIGSASMEEDDPVVMLMQSIEAEAHEAGWDAPPAFFLILYVSDLTGVANVSPEAVGALGARSFILPESWYHDPSQITPFLARFLREEPEGCAWLKPQIPDEYFGIAMISEGWTVPQPAPDSPEWASWNDARRLGMFHAHPDRREQRVAQVYLLNGRELMIQRTRGEFPVVLEPGVDGLVHLGGNLPTACRSIRDEFAKILKED